MALYYSGVGNLTGQAFNNLSAFKPQIYPLQFIQKFYAGSITNYVCNTNWEGDILGPGAVVNLRYIPDVIVNASTNDGDVIWQAVQSQSAQLVLNYSFNGAYWVTDLDRSQIDVDMEGALINEMVNRLRLAIESTILGSAYLGAGTVVNNATNVGAGTWAATSGSNCITATAYCTSLLSIGSGNGIDLAPWDDRFLVIHPTMITGMITQQAFYALNAGTPKGALYEGFLAKINGMNVLQSPLVPGANTSGSPYQALVGHPEAITMATKFTNVQADIVLPNKFGVGTRCQNFFGFSVVKPILLVNLQVYGA
jgi:hypothetical protein